MDRETRTPQSFSPLRRVAILLNVGLAVAALLAVVVMVNYLAVRHFRRFQWTSDARYELSPHTRQVLQGLTNQVRVTLLFDRTAPLFGAVSGLLREYSYICPRLTLEHIDYKRDVGRAQLALAKYQLAQGEADQVVFELQGRSKVVRAAELSEYDWTGLLAGQREVRRVAFRGEALFTGAIAGLLEGRSPMVGFLQGHGEHDPGSDEAATGYSTFARLLRQQNIVPVAVSLTGAREVPADCQVLVIAGPQNRFEPAELEKVGKYLAQGGRLLALLSYPRMRYASTGLERLLAGWGVAVGDNLALDPKNSRSGTDLVVTNLSGHPIVKSLQRSKLYLVNARWVGAVPTPAQSPEAPRVQVLASTGEEGYTASDITPEGVVQVNPVRDRRGIIPVAVAVEKGSLQGVSADRASTRIVAVGESLFLGNVVIDDSANLDFANRAINWLLDRPQHLAGILPRPIQEYRIALSQAEMRQLRWILLAGLPGAVLLLGLMVWARRRA
jgi:ABC-type uncharacterized transport system involved in gliding motility auxiliary subunit